MLRLKFQSRSNLYNAYLKNSIALLLTLMDNSNQAKIQNGLFTSLKRRIKHFLQFCPINLHIGTSSSSEKLTDITRVIKIIAAFDLKQSIKFIAR